MFDQMADSLIIKTHKNQMKILKVDGRSPVLNTGDRPFNCIGKVVAGIQVEINGI